MKSRKWLYAILGVGLFLTGTYFIHFKMPCGSCDARGCWDGICNTKLISLFVNRFNLILLTVVGSLIYFWRKQKLIFIFEIVALILLTLWRLK